MTYYLIETLNRKTGAITCKCPIEISEEIMKKWMEPYKAFLLDKLSNSLLANDLTRTRGDGV